MSDTSFIDFYSELIDKLCGFLCSYTFFCSGIDKFSLDKKGVGAFEFLTYSFKKRGSFCAYR